MPTYTYACQKCEHQMDVFHSMNDTPKVKCEACGSTRTKKLIGTGAGIIFKGSGFYETDYKNNSGKKVDKTESGAAEKKDAKTEGKSEAKSESKSETKSTSKSESKSSGSSGNGSKSD